ncbi:MAG: toxin [Thiolinea sp.]
MLDVEKISWNEEKNELLKVERGVSFEDVVVAIRSDQLLAVEAGAPNYPHQRLLVIEIRGYAYMVPVVISEQEIFLKTVIPSRRHTKRYLRPESDGSEEVS